MRSQRFHNQPSRFTPRGGFLFHTLRLFEVARVLVRFDHLARRIVNANHKYRSGAVGCSG
jgi:hypothetical protein